ncbi:cysteine--tRNA ligase [Candidatus Dojkabacteria bacterium]|nr:cysteine--tRNA ligase [Candidatus Dojkabacteria bacterium]
MKIYNTLTRSVDEFTPINENKVNMYVCGPTVYGPSHLGHASTYITFDIIRRAFIYLGYEVKYVVNLTDVHDDMIKEANHQGITIFELADTNIKQYMKDLDALNIMPADVYPRVTDHIKEIVDMVSRLEKKGYAYETADGVYYRVSKFENYGKLSGIKFDEGVTGQRVDTDKYDKDSVADFALWKKAKEGEPSWESPWGQGRPGWHIECSVMSEKYLGQPFDIHGGALDLRFPHHENEIAQSEAANDKKFVNWWMHAGLLNVNGKKMGKSNHNFVIIPDMLKDYDPMVIRYWRATVHYRSEINYDKSVLEPAQKALQRLRNYVTKLWIEVKGKLGEVDPDMKAQFEEKLSEDFNTPQAVAILWAVVKSKDISSKNKLATILDFDKVFAFNLKEFTQSDHKISDDLTEKIEQLVREREEARSNKDWDMADKLRGEIENLGVTLEDTATGPVWNIVK